MEIDTITLLAYAIIWTLFYAFLSRHIAKLSRDRWVEYVKSEESDEVLVEALQAVIEEIEDRMHDKLEAFQHSFFGSVGNMTKKAKELDPMNGIRKAAKDGDWTSMLVEYAANKAGLSQLIPQQQQKTPPKQSQNSGKLGLK